MSMPNPNHPGKGSKPRKSQVSRETYVSNHEATYGVKTESAYGTAEQRVIPLDSPGAACAALLDGHTVQALGPTGVWFDVKMIDGRWCYYKGRPVTGIQKFRARIR